ncbi:TPA: hypothetical protein DCF80_01870 [Candidatus Saccharibacteria bacterium]|nr:hypothetical protein [Candidatus Saccharibacteria bacterium]HRK40640.1 hypothetical protein [Candidatus Saccharibacteria bacterium]
MDSKQQHPAATAGRPKRRKDRDQLFIAIGGVVIVLVGLVTWLWMSAPERPLADRYQAVFLDNGQAFFGKLKNVTGEYLVIEEAYRAQAQDLPSDATDEQKEAVANNVSLIKVGKEVYGPENAVRVRAEQVVYWQNLTPDSKVSKAIEDNDE